MFLYELIELQREMLRPLRGTLEGWAAGGTPAPWPGFASWLVQGLRTGDLGGQPIEEAVAARLGRRLRHELVAATPFVRLLHLGAGALGRRIVLLVPHSGYATSVLVDLVMVLLEVGEVIVTDWVDARLVPAEEGPFGLEQQHAVALAALRHAGSGADLVAVSQSGWAALAALRTVAAAAPEVTPRSVVLLGSPIDPLRRPVPLQQMVAALPEPLELSGLLTKVPATQPGAGRTVFPSLIQLAAVASSAPSTYAEVQLGTLLEHLGWLDRGYRAQHRSLHALVDVPGELFTELVALHKGRDLEFGGAPWSQTGPLLEALRPATRLITVEAAADSLVGPGQTHAARALLGTPDGAELTIEGAEHQDLFVGPLFTRRVAPALRDFLA